MPLPGIRYTKAPAPMGGGVEQVISLQPLDRLLQFAQVTLDEVARCPIARRRLEHVYFVDRQIRCLCNDIRPWEVVEAFRDSSGRWMTELPGIAQTRAVSDSLESAMTLTVRSAVGVMIESALPPAAGQ
jgi:hypothetical protein